MYSQGVVEQRARRRLLPNHRPQGWKLRLGAPGLEIAVVAPKSLSRPIADRLPCRWNVRELWDVGAIVNGVSGAAAICMAPPDIRSDQNAFRINVVREAAAAAGTPLVLYLTEYARRHAVDQIAKPDGDSPAVVLQGPEDHTLPDVLIGEVLKPLWCQLREEIRELPDLHFGLRRVLCEVVSQVVLPPSSALELRASGQPPFIRRIKDLERLRGKFGSRTFLASRAKRAGLPLYEALRRNTILHAFPRYSDDNSLLAIQLSFRTREAFQKYFRRVVGPGVREVQTWTLREMAAWFMSVFSDASAANGRFVRNRNDSSLMSPPGDPIRS